MCEQKYMLTNKYRNARGAELQYEATAWELGNEHSEMRSVIVKGTTR